MREGRRAVERFAFRRSGCAKFGGPLKGLLSEVHAGCANFGGPLKYLPQTHHLDLWIMGGCELQNASCRHTWYFAF